MEDPGSRWVLPSLQSALSWCERRNATGIRCIVDVLGEYARDTHQAAGTVDMYLTTARAIADRGLDASLTVKLSALGALVDREECLTNVLSIAQEAANLGLGFEMDMEGQSLVTYAIDVAAVCAENGNPVSLALQAYLNRTPEDLTRALPLGITARIVKGAYVGSIKDFTEIQLHFKELVAILRRKQAFFSIGTHDPDLIEWTKGQMKANRDLIEFGFLKGLADGTKIRMAREGWRVAEYIPFGNSHVAYETRREKYLKALESLGRAPLP